MQPAHASSSYRIREDQAIEIAIELGRLAALHAGQGVVPSTRLVGRNKLTRSLDLLLYFVRRYLPPLHWMVGRSFAAFMFCYARWLGYSIDLSQRGSCQWRDNLSKAVLVTWHGEAPALLSVLIAEKVSTRVVVLIATDPRGDYLALLCGWLGFRVVRGDSESGGWEAMANMAEQVSQGLLALITADGGGPALTAKVGAVALSSVTHAPVIPVGAACYPAVIERHKWDAARNPLPSGRVAVVCGQPISFDAITDATAFENARQQLQNALNQASQEARAYLNAHCE